MKFKFDANQQYQLDAIKAVVDLFDGQPIETEEFHREIKRTDSLLNDLVIANNLVIDDEAVKANTFKVQDVNELDNTIDFEIQGKNFSIEMETGTGI